LIRPPKVTEGVVQNFNADLDAKLIIGIS
jgi:hypothetical protein